MHEIDPNSARLALHDIDDRQQQIADEVRVPTAYWWGVALGWIALGVITDTATPSPGSIATLAFGAIHAAVAPRLLTGRHGSKQLSVRADVAGRHMAAVLLGGLVVAGRRHGRTGAARQADGADHPATMASVVVAVLLVCGGPQLVAALRRRSAAAGRPLMAEARFDELIHPSTRLSIVAMLAAADWIEFSYVRDRLGLSDSALSKQFSTLEAAGYVRIDRPSTGRQRRVRVALTATRPGGVRRPRGRAARRAGEHAAAARRLSGRAARRRHSWANSRCACSAALARTSSRSTRVGRPSRSTSSPVSRVTSRARIPGVKATCHGLSAWS